MTTTPEPTGEPLSFYGTVLTIDYSPTREGSLFRGLEGKVTIVSSRSAMGFDARTAANANWFAKVEGDYECHYVPGCKISSIVEHKLQRDNPPNPTFVLVVP